MNTWVKVPWTPLSKIKVGWLVYCWGKWIAVTKIEKANSKYHVTCFHSESQFSYTYTYDSKRWANPEFENELIAIPPQDLEQWKHFNN